MIEQLAQQLRRFPKTKQGRKRYITSSPQGWVQRLDLSHRGLRQVPEELVQLPHLQMLDLSHNQPTQLPAELGQLSHLWRLDLSHNPLTRLTAALGQLPRLEQLDLSGNPELQIPPPAVVAQGTQATLAYLRSLQEQE
jgi:Leucine-rich repeat (LRR) protein